MTPTTISHLRKVAAMGAIAAITAAASIGAQQPEPAGAYGTCYGGSYHLTSTEYHYRIDQTVSWTTMKKGPKYRRAPLCGEVGAYYKHCS